MPQRVRLALLVVALVLVAGLGGGLIVHFVGDRGDSPTPTLAPSAPGATASSGTPTYEPTDAGGSPEQGLDVGQASAGTGGSGRGPSDLPIGYERSEAGAATAATNYLIWMNSLRIADKTTADAMADTAANTPRTSAALKESFDALRSGMGNLSADEQQPARGAYAVVSYGATRALVYVWSPEVTTTSNGQTDQVWSIDAVQVVWASNDWKLDGGLIARTGGAAIDPADPAGNPSSAEKHSILTRTPADPGQIIDSARQTWLEYVNAPH